MPLRVLIIPDKFKGTLRAETAAAALAKGWGRVRPEDTLDLLPMSDGGEGFGAIAGRLLGAKTQKTKTVDAAHRPCMAEWHWAPESKTAVIETARVVGLAMLPRGRFHPFALDSFGLGALIEAGARKGASKCLIGIGGSATNDAGFGLARALGWTFLDRANEEITQWTGLARLEQIHARGRRSWFKELLVAVDVFNPLLGLRGATRVYGPQKGLQEEEFELAEGCLSRLASVVRRDLSRDLTQIAGAGAAGGLGFGLAAFAGARLESGFDLFSRFAGLEKRLGRADLVLTGEGAIDNSTAMGKGVGTIARRCRRLRIPCIGLAGTLIPGPGLSLFTSTYGLTDWTTSETARKQAAHWVERVASRIAEDFTQKPITQTKRFSTKVFP